MDSYRIQGYRCHLRWVVTAHMGSGESVKNSSPKSSSAPHPCYQTWLMIAMRFLCSQWIPLQCQCLDPVSRKIPVHNKHDLWIHHPSRSLGNSRRGYTIPANPTTKAGQIYDPSATSGSMGSDPVPILGSLSMSDAFMVRFHSPNINPRSAGVSS